MSEPVPQQGDPLKFDKPTRTDLHCHECSKTFIALLDYTINGNHVAECPYCGHQHFRVIIDGKITDKRWDSKNGSPPDSSAIRAKRIWKPEGAVLQEAGRTTELHSFLRQRWLEK